MAEDGITQELVNAERARDRTNELRLFVVTSAKFQTIPIFLSLWVMDFFYAPHLIWNCLSIRLLCIPLSALIIFLFNKPRSLRATQIIVSGFVLGNSILVVSLVLITEGMSSPYYAGLNLITSAIVCFPWTGRFLVLNIGLIYLPFVTGVLLKGGTTDQLRILIIHSFFIFGTVLICFVIRAYLEILRNREVTSRLRLKNEILSRDGVIRVKTAESLKLNQLAKQFSPQVVQAILSGKFTLDEAVSTCQICAVFIDIVHSTDRLQLIPINDFTHVISSFMKDTTHILLEHDVTIDKYLGDGVLAFSGAPVSHTDYVLRVVKAAWEIRAMFLRKQEEYVALWNHPFEVRFGIARGFANVGFYGSEAAFRSYTAIGEPVNLASRLCASAEPNSILIEGSMVPMLKGLFHLERSTKATFKGFEARTFETYNVVGEQNREEKAA